MLDDIKKTLWATADKLRAHMDAAEYKHLVLGLMFVQSEKFIEAHGGKICDVSIYGQEANPITWRLAAMNLAIRGIDFNLGREPGAILNAAKAVLHPIVERRTRDRKRPTGSKPRHPAAPLRLAEITEPALN